MNVLSPSVLAASRTSCLGGVHESNYFYEVLVVSIIRIGLAETKHFSKGYEAIFGGKKKKDDEDKPAKEETGAKKSAKKPSKKKGKK